MGVPVLGRTQAKLMDYISHPEIHAPQQQQSSVSQDSIKSTDHVHSLVTMQHSQQSNPKFDWKFDQSKFDQKFDQTAQQEHRVVAEAKLGAAHEPKSPQVSWCKNSITIDGKTHPLPTTKEYILHEYADVFRGI